MSNLPLPIDLREVLGIQLPSGKWYEIHPETMSVGPVAFIGPEGQTVMTNVLALTVDAVEVDEVAGRVGEKPFKLTCRLDAIVAYTY